MSSVRFKRIIIFVLCLSCALGSMWFDISFISTPSAKASVVDNYKDQIAELEKEQEKLQQEIDSLKNDKTAQNAKKQAMIQKIDNLQTQINVCNAQVATLNQQISDVEVEIENKSLELKEARYAYMQRLRAIYMSGGTTASSLTVLMSADGLNDLLTKSAMTQSINAYDNVLSNKLVNDMKAIEEKKNEIKALVAQQEVVKGTLNTKKGQLYKELGVVNSEISDINADIKDIEAQKKANEKAMEELEEAIKQASNVGSDQIHEGDFLWPVKGFTRVTSGYGYRIHPIYGYKKFHKGIDISDTGIKGKPILAAADGTVSIAKYNSGGYGYYVMINHGKSVKDGKYYATLYAHMSKYIVSVGQKVTAGQVIGYVGTTGASTGYHLHYEVRRGDKSGGDIFYDTTNPMNYY